MSTEPVATPVEPISEAVDLDDFSADFFGRKTADPEPASSEVVEPEPEDSDVTEETEATNPETQEADTDDTTEETEADGPKADEKPKKKTAQDRIAEVIRERNAERQAVLALQAELAQLKNPQSTTPTPATTDGMPSSDEKNEDGSAKYPLGDFDPKYVRDLAVFTVTQQIAEQRKVEEAAKVAESQKIQQQTLVSEWSDKLTPALERYPDFQEKAQDLLDNLTGLDADYEDYIAATIMQLDYGPDVLYYLSSNPAEAQAIVNSGPTKAAVLLGRLESKYMIADAEKTLARPKVSNAPAPPPTNKGSSAVKASVAPDTDDLEAFERAFNKKKK